MECVMTAYLLNELYSNNYKEGWCNLIYVFLDKKKAEIRLKELVESNSEYTYNLIEMDIQE